MTRLIALMAASVCLWLGTQFGTVQAAPQTITPGAVWRDTEGHVIQAHGGGIVQAGKTYYWFGEDHAKGYPFQDIPCYASQDLAHWTFRSYALKPQPGGDLGPNRVVERPKVLYNHRTKTYVMYLHIDDTHYAEAKVGVATSRNVEGPYTYRGSFRPRGHESRDMTLFQDGDGTAYVVFEDRGEGGGLRIDRLSADYLSVISDVATVGGRGGHEAPAVVHIGDTYYLLGSHLSGWNTNDNEYAAAPSLTGPWSVFRPVAPQGTRTYNSQTAFILQVKGKKTTSYIYLGDRWNPGNLGDSRYIWLPLAVGDHSLYLPSDTAWAIDTKTGLVTPVTPTSKP